MGRRLLWTPEAVALVGELKVQGLGPTAIGRQIGVSSQRVGKLFARLRQADGEGAVPPRRQPLRLGWWDADGRREAALVMVMAGMTMAAIADELGTSRNAVIGVVARARMAQQAAAEVEAKIEAEIETRELAGLAPATLEDRLRWAVVMAPGCRWVFGTPLAWSGCDDWRWCGVEPLVTGSAYCQTHWRASRQ
jgi:hypothetical protein